MLKTLFYAIMAGVLFGALSFAYEKFLYRKAKPDRLDRVMITPGPMSYCAALFCVLFCLLQAWVAIEALIAHDFSLVWVMIGIPVTLLMGFCVYVILWTRIRVSGASVEYRGIKGWDRYEWDDVLGIFDHSFFGSRLHVKGRKPKPVWLHGRGVKEVAELFALYVKPFER